MSLAFVSRIGQRRRGVVEPTVIGAEHTFVQYDDARSFAAGSSSEYVNDGHVVGRTVHEMPASFSSHNDIDLPFGLYAHIQSPSSRVERVASSRRFLRRMRVRMTCVRSTSQEIDDEHLSYEDIMALEEWMGNVPIGVDDSVLKKLRTKDACLSRSENCPICLAEYSCRDTVRELGCSHEFHLECIDMWFREKNSCPVCKSEVK